MLKKLGFGFLMTLFITSTVLAQNNDQILSKKVLAEKLDYFYQGTWEKLQKKAAKKKQFVLVDFYTDWCVVCKQMKQVVFASNEAIDYYSNNNYMVYSLDAENRPDIAKKFKVSQYPTYIFLDNTGKEVHRITGMMTKTSFLQASKEAAKPKVPYTEFSFFR